MPELPDVEVMRRYMEQTSLYQRISEAVTYNESVLENLSAERLNGAVEGKQFERTVRHGKYLFAGTNNSFWIVFHFGMTGYLDYHRGEEKAHRHTRVEFFFQNGQGLSFILQRKLGGLWITGSVAEFVEKQGLGPDALNDNLGPDELKGAAKNGRSSIKSFLMNQQLIAGIGNIYSDEILFQAGILPRAMAKDISSGSWEKLATKIKEVLTTAIERGADPGEMPGSYLLPHRREGGVCPRCKGGISIAKISGRTAYFCAECQS
ncbi:MAG: DNA-formamidopyrimidine glycosylase family protein [Dehalococcoidales bacterium]